MVIDVEDCEMSDDQDRFGTELFERSCFVDLDYYCVHHFIYVFISEM